MLRYGWARWVAKSPLLTFLASRLERKLEQAMFRMRFLRTLFCADLHSKDIPKYSRTKQDLKDLTTGIRRPFVYTVSLTIPSECRRMRLASVRFVLRNFTVVPSPLPVAKTRAVFRSCMDRLPSCTCWIVFIENHDNCEMTETLRTDSPTKQSSGGAGVGRKLPEQRSQKPAA